MNTICARVFCMLLAASLALCGVASADEIKLAISEPPAAEATATPEVEAAVTPEVSAKAASTGESAGQDAIAMSPSIASPDGGTLADIAQGEVVVADYERGYWFYSDSEQNVRIEIQRYEDTEIELIWYEADLQYGTETPMTLYAANPERPGKGFKYAERIARDNKLVFAVNDDQCGHRMYNRQTVGVIVRDGEIVSNRTKRSGNKSIPNLDVGALFDDGTMKVFQSKDYTAQEYLDMGCRNTLSFGPWIVMDGEMNPIFETNYRVREPRLVLGMIGPRHYVAMLCEGRTSRSQGVALKWVGERMLELGVSQCINLDGGETACMLFMGRRLEFDNRYGKFRLERSLSGMIGLGTCADVPEFSKED